MNLIYKHENKLLLHSAKNLLELNGIECLIKNEHSASGGGNLGITNAAAELWVLREDDAEQAMSIIAKEIENSDSKPAWVCKQCGEENDGSFELCWSCQNEAGSEQA